MIKTEDAFENDKLVVDAEESEYMGTLAAHGKGVM
jgi:hypothetical protein